MEVRLLTPLRCHTYVISCYIYDNFQMKKKSYIFLIFAKNIGHGYTLDPQGGSYEYPRFSVLEQKLEQN